MKYTWIRRNVASRIDKMLVEAQFMGAFPNMLAFCKDRLLSDHYPIVLSSSQLSWGLAPFRSLDCWLQKPSFIQVFKKEWLQLTGLPFNEKLKKLKASLKKWNREVFGHIDHRIQAFQVEMAKLDAQAQDCELQEICLLYTSPSPRD